MGKDSSEIRREIEETRARMGETVEALGYKADVPSRLKDNVNERVETMRGTIGDVVDNVKETVAGATGKVGDALGRAQEATTTARSNVQQTVGQTVNRGAGIAAENPIGLALGALAVGFLAGLVAPVSEIEREKVGPLRDQLMEKAKDYGSEVVEQGKAVLQETVQVAMGNAQSRHGSASEAGMPRDRNQGGGLRGETLMSGGTGAQTERDTGRTSSQYRGLLEDGQNI